MNLSLLLDMNISPSWVALLHEQGLSATHWSDVGAPTATDETVMAYARLHGHALVTHDLDFTHLLALTHAAGPSVILLRRLYAVSQKQATEKIAQAIFQYKTMLTSGALIVIDAVRSRIRVLPLRDADD